MDSKLITIGSVQHRLSGTIFSLACCAALLGFFVNPAPVRADSAAFVSFSTVDNNAYGATDINSCAIQVNNLTTVQSSVLVNNVPTPVSYQYIGYYNPSGDIMVGRRTSGTSNWVSSDTGINVNQTNGNLGDDHNVIALAVDSGGYMHMSWGMHNISLNYAISSAPVTGATFSSSTFADSPPTIQTAANAPTLFPNAGTSSSTTNEATYPVFTPIPNSSNLLFTYRNGGAGGGSGNGNHYFNVYNPTSKTWSNNFVINGEFTSVNAYLNSMAYTSTGTLLMSWTWRATSNWQTNSNIMFAQSPDNGTSWYQQGGTTAYDLPIIQNQIVTVNHGVTTVTGDPKSVAQVIQAIPQNSSFINQTSMTVDANNNPFIATYYAPGSNSTKPVSSTNNPNLQYMLTYYTGTQWKTSQISNRTSDKVFDTSAAYVRDLGRPVVLTDPQGRVLVVTRSEDTGQGSFSNAATPNNGMLVYYNTVASLDSSNPAPWQSIRLDTTNLGQLEPTFDSSLWNSQHVLDLFFEPLGLSGETTGTVSVMQWDEQAYFATLPEPGTLSILVFAGFAVLRRRPQRCKRVTLII